MVLGHPTYQKLFMIRFILLYSTLLQMNVFLKRLYGSLTALIIGILVTSCANDNSYEWAEYEKYCFPLYKLSGSPSAYEKTFIQNYPNKRDYTYTSEIGDTIISKGLVTNTKKTLISLKSKM